MADDPFWNRPKLKELYEPLVGDSMLELGDKLDAGRVYKPYFESLGIRHVSIDINGNNGALPLDLTKPLNLGKFSMVTNIGTSEHVSEDNFAGQVECWRNIVEAMDVGSVLICDTPAPGTWRVHGTWYPTQEFYAELARLNGMDVERLSKNDWRPGRSDRQVISARLVMRELRPFAMPKGLMYQNGTGKRF